MPQKTSTAPILIGLLALPYGLACGWCGALGFRLMDSGFYRVPAMGVISWGLSLYMWRIVIAPVIDSVGSLRRWYLIGLTLTIAGLLPFFWLSATPDNTTLMTILLGASHGGGILMLLATAGLMKMSISPRQLGKAAGWYQSGIIGGQGLVLTVAAEFRHSVSWTAASTVEIALILTGFAAILGLQKNEPNESPGITERARQVAADVRAWFGSRKGIFITLMAVSPIGVGAATIAWSNGAAQHEIPMEQLTWVIGTFTPISTVAGYLAGGWASDRFGRWKTWLWAGVLLAAAALLLAFCPDINWLFLAEMLLYSFLSACCAAAFLAIIVREISARMAVTKITLLSMLTSYASIYMQSVDGRLNDDFSFRSMLIAEVLLSLVCIGIALLLKRKLRIEDEKSPILSI